MVSLKVAQMSLCNSSWYCGSRKECGEGEMKVVVVLCATSCPTTSLPFDSDTSLALLICDYSIIVHPRHYQEQPSDLPCHLQSRRQRGHLILWLE